jgi:hypothetical protein
MISGWERENWGCVCGAYEAVILDESEHQVVYDFLTAWAPPIAFLATAAKQWPTLTFLFDYEEPGVGFKGIARFKGETKEGHRINQWSRRSNRR